MSWRIRKAGGGTFGPVDWPDVLRWVREGRIVAGDELSDHNGPWRPASEIQELELDWLLERGGGATIGPLHAQVIVQSICRQILGGGEFVRHRISGARQTAAHLALASLATQREQLQAALEDARQQAILQAPRPDKADATGLEKTLQDLTRRYEGLLARTREQEEQLRDLHRQLAEATAGPQGRIAELEDAVRAADSLAEQRRKKVEDLDAQLAELTRSFRDLNERYIRLRDEGAGGTGAPGGKPKVRLA